MSGRRKSRVVVCTIVVGVLLLFLFSPIGCSILGVFVGGVRIFRSESAMRRPDVFEPVGHTLALYCQSDPSLFPKWMDYAWLPEELNAIGQGTVSVGTDHAEVEMGGGFHHFGYRLGRDASASTLHTNAWRLCMYSEGSSDRYLMMLLLDSGQRLSPEQVLARVIAGYDAQLRRQPRDEQAHQGKVQTCLRFGRITEARQACRAMLHAIPDGWWPVLVNALILAEEASLADAEKFIRDWVAADPNFFRYMDLAYFYQLTGEPKKSAEAMQRSTEHSASTMWGHGGNSEHRGYTAAMYAYESAEYETTIRLCDHLLKVKINGGYAKPGLQELRNAAVKARQQQGASMQVRWAEAIRAFDPFGAVDIEKLLGRPVPRKTNER